MPTHTRDIHGHKVTGEDNAVKGMDYLDHELSYQEAEVFFRQAKARRQVQFQDDDRRNFTLMSNDDGTYTLQARKESKGLFGGWI